MRTLIKYGKTRPPAEWLCLTSTSPFHLFYKSFHHSSPYRIKSRLFGTASKTLTWTPTYLSIFFSMTSFHWFFLPAKLIHCSPNTSYNFPCLCIKYPTPTSLLPTFPLWLIPKPQLITLPSAHLNPPKSSGTSWKCLFLQETCLTLPARGTSLPVRLDWDQEHGSSLVLTAVSLYLAYLFNPQSTFDRTLHKQKKPSVNIRRKEGRQLLLEGGK